MSNPPDATVTSTRPTLFLKLGEGFKIDADAWLGTTVASAQTLYLVMRGPTNLVQDAAKQVVRAAFSATPDDANIVRLQNISPDIRDHRDWPAKLSGNWEVLVIPRHAVQSIIHPRFTNLLCLDFHSRRIQIEYSLFTGARVRDYLTKTGWSLDWGTKWPWK